MARSTNRERAGVALYAKTADDVRAERTDTSQIVYKINELLQARDANLMASKVEEICNMEGASTDVTDADRKKLQGWRVHLLSESGSKYEQIAAIMKISVDTVKRAHSIYKAITVLGKLRYYTGNMDELRKCVSKLQKEATRLGTIDQWNKDEQRKTIHVNGVEMLAIPYLLGID